MPWQTVQNHYGEISNPTGKAFKLDFPLVESPIGVSTIYTW